MDETVRPPAGDTAFPAGDSEMTRLIRDYSWAATPLGSIENWPQSLKTAVDIMLASPGPVSILWGPERLQIYNDAYIAIAAERHPASLGRSARETWAEAYETFLGPIFDRVFQGETVTVNDQRVLLRCPGGFGLEERYFTASFLPIRDETGAVAGAFHPLTETTQAKRQEAALRENEHRFRAIVETATDYAIFTTDATGRIETWPTGAEAVFGWMAAEAVGQMVDITFTHEDRAKGDPAKERQTAREKGQAPNIRWHQRKDGSRVFIDGVMRPLRGEDGELTGFVKVGQDVTERRRTEEQLQLATEAAELGIFDVDLVTLGMHWDARQRVLWGIGADEIITDEIFVSGIHPDDRERVRAAVAQAYDPKGDGLYAAEFWVRPLDGAAERWIAAKGRVHFDGPRPVRLVGTVQDVTVRMRTEAHLRELNETLEQQVAERTAERDRVWWMSRDLSVVIGTDGVVRAANPAVRRILGYEPDEVVGRSFRLFVYPDDADRTQLVISETVAGQEVTAFEARFRHKDGTLRWISWHTSAEGNLVYANGRDVSADKERQAQLEAAEAARREADVLYRAYFESASDALFVIRVEEDGGFVVEQVNPAHEAQIGFSLDVVAGKRIEEVLPPGLAEQVTRAYRRVVETGEIYQYREVFDLPGGQQHWDNALAPVPGTAGRITRIFGSSRNVTQQVQAEEALRQSQKMEAMGQLTGGVAHDFNNLLTPIIASLDMLLRRGIGSERERRLMDGALQSAERAKVLVQRLLAFARRQPLQPRAVDMRELVTGMAELIASTSGPRIDVRVELPDDLPPALADANQLEMAVLNLAVNARDAMPDAGVLTISAARVSVRGRHPAKLRPGHYVRLSVQDTGTGMDEATLARAIEPFFSTKGIGKGTGLGLSMVHGLASQLNGGLSIVSRPGEGTTVDLWLPISPLPAEGESKDRDSVMAPKALGTALLVDDEDLVRMSTADMLMDLGYEVVEASSAEEALRMVSEGLHPDLVVTDHLMPGLSGAELARDLRASRSDLPVLIVSGYAEMDGIAPGLPRLTKPFRAAELAASLAALLPAGST